MRTIELFDQIEIEHFVYQGHTHAEASIAKWQGICEALETILSVVKQRCGLCEENRSVLSINTCEGCPLYDPEHPDTICCKEYETASGSLGWARENAEAMLHILEEVQE